MCLQQDIKSYFLKIYKMGIYCVHSSGQSLFSSWEPVNLCVITCKHSVRESDSGCRPSALRRDVTSVLCGVTRVGLVAKGLLIKGDMDLELVLMCREKPTKLLLYTLSANLPLQIQVRSDTPPALRRSSLFGARRESTAEEAGLGEALNLCNLTFSRNARPQRGTCSGVSVVALGKSSATWRWIKHV